MKDLLSFADFRDVLYLLINVKQNAKEYGSISWYDMLLIQIPFLYDLHYY